MELCMVFIPHLGFWSNRLPWFWSFSLLKYTELKGSSKLWTSRFHKHKLLIQKFKLHMTLVDLKWASVVDKWIQLALQHNAKEIDLNNKTKGDTWYTFPGTILVANSTSGCLYEQPFYRSAVKLNSLQKLWLKDIYVSEETLQDIFCTYPFISNSALIRCQGLKHLDIAACHNLKILCLRGVCITDQDLHFIISIFPHLETLQVISYKLRSVKISAQGLRMLTFDKCHSLEVEIDAPNLLSIQYHGFGNKFPMIFLKNAPCSFELGLTFYTNHLMDTLWFLKLREFLVRSNWRKVLRLTIICPKVCPLTQLINFHQVFSLMFFYFCNFNFCLVRSFFTLLGLWRLHIILKNWEKWPFLHHLNWNFRV